MEIGRMTTDRIIKDSVFGQCLLSLVTMDIHRSDRRPIGAAVVCGGVRCGFREVSMVKVSLVGDWTDRRRFKNSPLGGLTIFVAKNRGGPEGRTVLLN